MSIPKKFLKEALALSLVDQTELVDSLLVSFDASDKAIDQLWMEEVENRIDAHARGEIKTLKIEEVLQKYK